MVSIPREMLEAAHCPECDGSGTKVIGHQDEYDRYSEELEQCQWCDVRATALSTPSSISLHKPRGAYEPLTEAQIEAWREHWKNAPRFTDDAINPEEIGELDRLCNMATNCLLYAQEIDRLRSLPPSATMRSECPYCTSDNEGIRGTYYDQTCEGCVKRMCQP